MTDLNCSAADRQASALIKAGKAVLGIEFGSTRIKAVLIDSQHRPLAVGAHVWENRLDNGLWTYSLDDIWSGLQACYADLARAVEAKYGVEIRKLGAVGFSAMMHGYMAFDRENALLVPFRTWRNTNTDAAAAKLTALFNCNIPLRWSIAHLYQCILDNEPHVKDIDYLTTLAGYIHWQLTDQKVLGIGDASGMFPIDSEAKDYDKTLMQKFDALVEPYAFSWRLRDILPKVQLAGTSGGTLTARGAQLLDPSGRLQPGIPVCPPEGDAGTGMTATNSVAVRTGNVSAGTSVFAMLVLDRKLSHLHKEIDMVTTPAGDLAAMVHANNCTSDLNAWVHLFAEFAEVMGLKTDDAQLFSVLFEQALKGDANCGHMLSYGYYSGESILPVAQGRPVFMRMPNSDFTLANFMRTHLYSALGALKVGMDILTNEEHVHIEKIYGHGGWFKTPVVGQRIMAAAMNAPVCVMETAGEGGAWGMALLAAYMLQGAPDESLADYLSGKVFANASDVVQKPIPEDVHGFNAFIQRFKNALPVEQQAAACLRE